jgi:predicted lipid-binding transport protein (Tim44 family)
MTVMARPRLAWRGARRSLSFMIGLALLAVAASGTMIAGPEPRDHAPDRPVSVAASQPSERMAANRRTAASQPAPAAPETVPAAPAAGGAAAPAQPVRAVAAILSDQFAGTRSESRAPPARAL